MNAFIFGALFVSLGIAVGFGFMLIFQLETRVKRLERRNGKK